MRRFQTVALGVGLLFVMGFFLGCGDDGKSDSEVHRTPEFQKAALNSRDAMLEFSKSQKAKPQGNSKTKKSSS